MKNIAVVFGGKSSEHEVSCVSAATIIKNINRDEYTVYLIGITKEGKWLLVPGIEAIEDGSWVNSKACAVISPDASEHGIIITENGEICHQYIDVVFPVLHGLWGEDGTIQGLLELSGIPYVGCGVVASAVSMDKFYTKIIVDTLNIRQAAYVPVLAKQLKNMDEVVKRVEDKFQYPVFVKPSNAGSSQGVSKAHNRDELEKALVFAAGHDHKILVEETIEGREIECGVLSENGITASGVGEVVAADEFYSYDAKYNNSESRTVINPDIPDEKVREIRRAACEIFRAVDGFGLARIDFFLENGTNEIVFNELNTLPGFTSISMYPMLFKAAGIDTPELVEKLINLSFVRE